ncbi:hypothetical protein KY289_026230 [Solanum tuberosum]|nr:hypothetical protein KY289_026230 [Solanum tuberosum]
MKTLDILPICHIIGGQSYLIPIIAVLRRLRKELQELRVFPSDPFAPGPNVSLTEQGLVAVSMGCPKLQSISWRLETALLAMRLCWLMLQSWRQCDPFGCLMIQTVSGRKFNTPGFVWIIDEDAALTPYSNGNCSLASS